MTLYWLCHHHNNQIYVVIEPGCFTRSRSYAFSLAGLDEGEFTETHELDLKWRMAKEMIGRRLSQEEAKRVVG
jgi:hypothetical protein